MNEVLFVRNCVAGFVDENAVANWVAVPVTICVVVNCVSDWVIENGIADWAFENDAAKPFVENDVVEIVVDAELDVDCRVVKSGENFVDTRRVGLVETGKIALDVIDDVDIFAEGIIIETANVDIFVAKFGVLIPVLSVIQIQELPVLRAWK